MECPNCRDTALRPVLTKQGVVVDYCDVCKGVWLDRGELFHFAKKPMRVSQALQDALKRQSPTHKRSPRTGKPMVQIAYRGALALDYCPASGGLWFDAGELKALLEQERNVRFALDRKAAARHSEKEPAGTRVDRREARRHRRIRSGLLPLPNLFLRSTVTLTGLYALLGAVLIAAVEFAGMSLDLAVGIGIGIVLLQFLIGPFLMDLSLRWLYRMQWVPPSELPEHLRQFVDKVCKKKRIKFPRFGIINDGAPQAFTYGHVPNNARIVISRGILELLEPEEAEAVVAHELGHAVHWDMFLMTIAQLVPLLLYFVYRSLIRMRRAGRNNKSAGARIAIAIGAYVLYIISEYVVLWFSRTREYHADRFAGEVTGRPSTLASALVKIAYGLAGQKKEEQTEETESRSTETKGRSTNLAAIGALGIFDAGAAQSLAITSYAEGGGAGAPVNKEQLKGAMRWDLWNPWAKWYELHSTHPLVAHRLRYLSDQAVHKGQEPYVVFDQVRPESYWDEFFTDLTIHLLPLAALLVPLAFFGLRSLDQTTAMQQPVWPVMLTLLGAALLLRFRFSYRGGYFPEMSVASLLKRVKVSAVRPVPCTLRGTIIGRGVPGYLFSEDFVLKDDTGIMFLDYRQPLGLWELLFALLKAEDYQGREVVVEGWYRRAPVPYVELKSIRAGANLSRSWVPFLYRLTAIALLVAGLIWGMGAN